LNSPALINSPLNKSFEKKANSKPLTPPEYNSNADRNKDQNKQISAFTSKQQQNSSKTSKTNSNSNLLIFSNNYFF